MKNTSFDFKRIAQGYKERPFLHKFVIDKLKQDMNISSFSNGLDVGCGAGLSTKALKMICNDVTGTDISKEMICVAQEVCKGEGYHFFIAKAEDTPPPSKKYDIVTAAGVHQWVQQEKFLKNMHEVMEYGGLMVVYDFAISDKMKGSEAYTNWWHEEYLKEFPKPYRNEHIWTSEEVGQYGFSMEKQVNYNIEYKFDLNSFIKFMMIQSNVNAKIEEEGMDILEVEKWFQKSLKPIFDEDSKTLLFSGYSWYIKNE
jgi:ubiquinone/menaquinone biosynthesis C-methylase UbiE